ncbi:hypothetical protein JHW43_006235 [Diplocarpon mali]|nr:hypothetical protein JHW43_006235 [Diplocarpon mali]
MCSCIKRLFARRHAPSPVKDMDIIASPPGKTTRLISKSSPAVDSRPLPSGFIACHEHVDRATLGERAAAECPVVIRRRAALHSGHDDQKRAEHVNGDDTPTPYRAPQSSVLGGHRASARPLFPAWRPRSSLSVKGTAGSRR